jgi:hypothetical protein
MGVGLCGERSGSNRAVVFCMEDVAESECHRVMPGKMTKDTDF